MNQNLIVDGTAEGVHWGWFVGGMGVKKRRKRQSIGFFGIGLALSIFLLLSVGQAHADISVARLPTACADTSDASCTVSNINVPDNTYESYAMPSPIDPTQYMNFSSFGFTIPSDAVIVSAKVLIEYRDDTASVRNNDTKIRVFGASGTNAIYDIPTPSAGKTDINTTTEVSDTLDTGSDVNNAVIQFYAGGTNTATIKVDFVQLNVTYRQVFRINITKPGYRQNFAQGSLVTVTANITNTTSSGGRAQVQGLTNVYAIVTGTNENNLTLVATAPGIYNGSYTASSQGFDYLEVQASDPDYTTTSNTTEISIGTSILGIKIFADNFEDMGHNLTIRAYVFDELFNAITGATVELKVFGVNNQKLSLYDNGNSANGDDSANNGNYTNRYQANYYGSDEHVVVANKTGYATAQELHNTYVIGNETVMKLALNRQAVMDDNWAPDTTACVSSSTSGWPYDFFNGNKTLIIGYAIVLDPNGMPVSNTTVNFTMRYPNGSVRNWSVITTDENGIGRYIFNMNGTHANGSYKVTATATANTSLSANRTFIYDRVGCKNCHSLDAGDFSLGFTSAGKSPYTKNINGQMLNMHGNPKRADHKNALNNMDCTYCHIGYGTPVRSGAGVTSAQTPYAYGVHNPSFNTWNSTPLPMCVDCHTNANESTGILPEIKVCYDCHPKKNANLSAIDTKDSSGKPIYSDTSPASGQPYGAHNRADTVPCITCHGPVHNITTPISNSSMSNSYTDWEQCVQCHVVRKPHCQIFANGTATPEPVKCTICHSQDVHSIKWYDTQGNYTRVKENAGGCIACHEGGKFNTILSQPKAGSYSGPTIPTLPYPVNHSANLSSGILWGSYWYTEAQMCYYCHTKAQHNESGAGRLREFMGNNTVNSTNWDTSTWCASCHYANYSSYSSNDGRNHTYADTVRAFNRTNFEVPPEITGNTTNWKNNTGTSNNRYENHAARGWTTTYKDTECNNCHGGYAQSIGISKFLHNVQVGTAGGDITAPTVTVTSPTNTTYTSTSVWANVTLNEPGSSVIAQLDSTTNYTLTNTSGNWNYQLTSLANGAHQVRIFANDSLGNMNSTQVVYFTVDTIAPTITIQSPANTTTRSDLFNVTFGEVVNWSAYSVDGGANNTMGNVSAYNTTLTGLSDGPHSIQVYANDSAGNMNTSTSYWTRDTAPPAIAFVDPTPANGTTANGSSVFINITLTDSLSAVANATMDWNGTNYTMSGTGSNRYRNMTNLSNGNYSYKVYANDTLGNMNVSSTRTVAVNVTTPKWLNATLLYPSVEEKNVAQHNLFRVNATVACVGESGDCGVVNGTVRYNTTSSADTVVPSSAGATPFYAVQGAQPQTCNGGSALAVGQSCTLNWTVNATGSGAWALDVNFSSSTGLANDTADAYKNAGAATVYNKVMPKDWYLFSWPYEETAVSDALSTLGVNYATAWYWNGTDYLAYDRELPGTSDFQTMRSTRVYWINMTAADDINVSGATQSFNITLQAGWNTFAWPYADTATYTALSSIDGKWDFIEGWDAATQDWNWKAASYTNYVKGSMNTLEPTKGYWIYMNSPATYQYTPP